MAHRSFSLRAVTGAVAALRAQLVCTDVRTDDLARSVRFYRALGLRPISRFRMADGTQIVWMRAATTRQILELYRLAPGGPLYRPFRRSVAIDSSLIFGVEHMADIVRRLRALGARPVAAFDQGEVRFVFLRDPNGKQLELLSWIAPRGRPPPLTDLGASPRARRATSRRRGTKRTGKSRGNPSRRD